MLPPQGKMIAAAFVPGEVILRIGVDTAARSVTTAAKQGTLQQFAEFSRGVEILTGASLIKAGLAT